MAPVMRLLPLRTLPLASALPPEGLAEVLREVIGTGPAAPFCGSVGADGFVIRRIRDYGSTNLPVLRGRLHPGPDGGTRVVLNLRPPRVVVIFMGIWFAFLAAIAALIVAGHARDSGRGLLALVAPVGLAALSWLLATAVFFADARWAIEHFLAAVPALRADGEHEPGRGSGTCSPRDASMVGRGL